MLRKKLWPIRASRTRTLLRLAEAGGVALATVLLMAGLSLLVGRCVLHVALYCAASEVCGCTMLCCVLRAALSFTQMGRGEEVAGVPSEGGFCQPSWGRHGLGSARPAARRFSHHLG